MRRGGLPRGFVLGLLALVLSAPARAGGLEEVLACARANAPGRSSVFSIALRSIDRSGGRRTLEGSMRWKRTEEGLSKLLFELEMPLDVRGAAYLVLERASGQDMWVYLPDLGKLRRIHPSTISGQLFGTDFSYEDIARLRRIGGDPAMERLADEDLDGRRVYRLRARPGAGESSAYSRVDYFLDRASCLPLRIEFYAPEGRLRKLLTGDPETLRRAGAGWVLGSATIRDVVSGTRSQLELSDVEVDVELPDQLFDTTAFARGR